MFSSERFRRRHAAHFLLSLLPCLRADDAAFAMLPRHAAADFALR